MRSARRGTSRSTWSTLLASSPNASVWGRRSSAPSPAGTPARSSASRSKSSPDVLQRPEHERPKKRLGQHFLTDPNTARIVAQGVGRDDVVLEVGPGRGALTTVLAERAGLVHALELDPDVLPALETAMEPYRNVFVREVDALTFDYASLDPRPNKLVANLPYNVASPLVLRLLEEANFLAELRFMVQLEVARRMAAGRSTKDYGAYAVLVQLLAKG